MVYTNDEAAAKKAATVFLLAAQANPKIKAAVEVMSGVQAEFFGKMVENLHLQGQQVGREQAVREAFKAGAEWEMTEPALDEKETQGEFLNRGIAAYLATQQEKPGSDPNRCPKCGVAGWIDTSPIWKDRRRCRACKEWIDPPIQQEKPEGER